MKVKKKKSVKNKPNKKDEEIALLKSQLVRTLADYDNLTKRIERERETFGQVAKYRLVVNLLPALDMFYGAQSHLKDAGLAIAIQTFEESLADNGVIRIEAEVGGQFNEEYHEAIEAVEDKKRQNGEIVEVSLIGWKMADGMIIRPSKVKVNKRVD